MNPYQTTRRVASAARILLMVVSLGGIGVLAVWFRSPATIDAIDADLRQRHLVPHQRLLDDAERAEQLGEHRAAISYLEEARLELRSVLKGDRLDPLRRLALERLARAYRAASRDAEAIAVLDEWIEFDARDLRPVAMRASWQGPEGIDTLLDLHQRFRLSGDFEVLDQSLAELLLEAGREVDALGLAADMMSELPDRRWQVFWDDGSGFRQANSRRATAVIDDAGALSFNVSLPGDARRLRIDGPAYPLLVMDLSIRFVGRGSPVKLPLWNATPRRQVRTVGKRMLEMAGEDTQIHIPVPPSVSGAERLVARVRGKVMTAPHPRLTDLLASPVAGTAIEVLENRGDVERARLLRQVRKRLRTIAPAPAPASASGEVEKGSSG